MGTILIDKLLMACVKQGASDIHITVGQPPVFRLHGHLRRLETKVLGPEDTTALMKSIAPDRCQQELQEVGGSDFGFAFGDLARFRVSIFKQRGQVAMVLRQIPNEMMTFEQLGLPKVIEPASPRRAGSSAGLRASGRRGRGSCGRARRSARAAPRPRDRAR